MLKRAASKAETGEERCRAYWGFGVGEPGWGWGDVVPGVEFVDVGGGGEVAVAELEGRGGFGVGGGVVG